MRAILILKMKFSYRVLLALALVATLGALFVYYKDLWKVIIKTNKQSGSSGSDKSELSKKIVDQHLWPIKSNSETDAKNTEQKSDLTNKYEGNTNNNNKADSCSAPPQSAKVDIDTFDILNDVDNARQVPYIDLASNKGRDLAMTQDGKEKQLRVIVVPHSHNDPGWTKTLKEYFQVCSNFSNYDWTLIASLDRPSVSL